MGRRGARPSVMLANNEVASVQPVAEIARLAHACGARVHTDAVQAWEDPVDVAARRGPAVARGPQVPRADGGRARCGAVCGAARARRAPGALATRGHREPAGDRGLGVAADRAVSGLSPTPRAYGRSPTAGGRDRSLEPSVRRNGDRAACGHVTSMPRDWTARRCCTRSIGGDGVHDRRAAPQPGTVARADRDTPPGGRTPACGSRSAGRTTKPTSSACCVPPECYRTARRESWTWGGVGSRKPAAGRMIRRGALAKVGKAESVAPRGGGATT